MTAAAPDGAYQAWLIFRRANTPPSPTQAPQDSEQGSLHIEADTNLQNHFDSIQIISERTTLPQMLLELVKGLSRTADVSSLILRLK